MRHHTPTTERCVTGQYSTSRGSRSPSKLPCIGWVLFLLCVIRGPVEARNVVLFVTDDQSLDAGCYGNPIIQTPRLDRLAADATRMTQAFCTTASCSASRSVILSGLFNHRTAQYGHAHTYHHFRTYDRIKTLPVRLRELGYRTARVGKFHVAPDAVYPFDTVPGEDGTKPVPRSARSPVEMANSCREFVAAESQKPFFLYFCTSDPHRGGGTAKELPHGPDRFGNKPAGENYPGITPVHYSPDEVLVPSFLPDTPACRAELAQYYQSVSRVDQGVGRLIDILKEAGHWDDTMFIFMSDHGIAMPGAKTTLYEPGMRSPCIVRNPRLQRRGIVSDAMVSWVDVTPTILDFAGASPATLKDLDGRSFLGVLGTASAANWDEVYASHTFHEITMYYPMRVVRGRRFKLIWNIAYGLPYPFASDLWAAPTWQTTYAKGPDALFGKRTVRDYIHRAQFELYDLEKDPDEVRNLAADPEFSVILSNLKKRMHAFQDRTKDPWVRKWRYE
jgi:N-sulfoglucosamine sulfohydrolase